MISSTIQGRGRDAWSSLGRFGRRTRRRLRRARGEATEHGRMLIAGVRRRVDGEHVSSDSEGRKLTLSFVFGSDNAHSARMYSYFRYARTDLKYRELPSELTRQLDEHALTPTFGWGNRFVDHPDDLRGAHLRDPSKMDELITRFSGAAATS